MKSFSGLQPYASTSKLKTLPTFGKNSTTTNPFHKNSSSRNLGNVSQRNNRKNQNGIMGNRPKVTERLSRSIEQVPIYEERDMFAQQEGYGYGASQTSNRKKAEMLIQNCEEQDLNNYENSELYGHSYKKIDKIRKNFNLIKNKSQIEEQLQDILTLIRTQRENITQKMQDLQKQKQALQKKKAETSTEQVSTNTQQIIHCREQTICVDIETQTQEEDENSSSKAESTSPDMQNQPQKSAQSSKVNEGNSEIYLKLATMLDDMNINCKEILPSEIQLKHLSFEKKYKELTESEIIKVQKFFIKKLAQKISF